MFYVMMTDREDQRKREQALRKQRANVQNQPVKPSTIFPSLQKQSQVSPDKDGVRERIQRLFGNWSGDPTEEHHQPEPATFSSSAEPHNRHSLHNGDRIERRTTVNGHDSKKELHRQEGSHVAQLSNGSCKSYPQISSFSEDVKSDAIGVTSAAINKPVVIQEEKLLNEAIGESDLEKIIVEMRTMANTSVISPIVSPVASPLPPQPSIEQQTGLSQLLQDMEVSDTDESSSSNSDDDLEADDDTSGPSSASAHSDLDKSALAMKEIAENMVLDEKSATSPTDAGVLLPVLVVPAAVAEPLPSLNGHQTDEEPEPDDFCWNIASHFEKNDIDGLGPLSMKKPVSASPSSVNSSGFLTPEQQPDAEDFVPRDTKPEFPTKESTPKKKSSLDQEEMRRDAPSQKGLSPVPSPVPTKKFSASRRKTVKFNKPHLYSKLDMIVRFHLSSIGKIPETGKPISPIRQESLVNQVTETLIVPPEEFSNSTKSVKRKNFAELKDEVMAKCVTLEETLKKPKITPLKLRKPTELITAQIFSSEVVEEPEVKLAESLRKVKAVPDKKIDVTPEVNNISIRNQMTSGKEKPTKTERIKEEPYVSDALMNAIPEDLSLKSRKAVAPEPAKTDSISSASSKAVPKSKSSDSIELTRKFSTAKPEKPPAKTRNMSPPADSVGARDNEIKPKEKEKIRDREKEKKREKEKILEKKDSVEEKTAEQSAKKESRKRPTEDSVKAGDSAKSGESAGKKDRSVLDKILHKDPSVSRPKTAPPVASTPIVTQPPFPSLVSLEKNPEELWDQTFAALEGLDQTVDFEHQRRLARILKSEAESLDQNDPKRCAIYLQSVVHFSLMGQCLDSMSQNAIRVYQTTLNIISAGRMPSASSSQPCSFLVSVTRYLQCRTTAILCSKIYSFGEEKAFQYGKMCDHHRKESRERTVKETPPPKQKQANGNSPSPGTTASPYSVGSAGSGSHGSGEKPPPPPAPQEIIIPPVKQSMFMEYQHQSFPLVNALWQWNRGKGILMNEKNALLRKFDVWLMKKAPLTFDGTIDDLARHLYAALWVLRAIPEYTDPT